MYQQLPNDLDDLLANPLIVLMIFATFVVLLGVCVLWVTQRDASTSTDDLRAKSDKTTNENPNGNMGQYYFLFAQHTQYVDANLKRMSNIYVLSIVMILAGFLIIVYASWFYMSNLNASNLAATQTPRNLIDTPFPLIVAGVVIEFIAATILFLYRSVSKESIHYFQSIDRFAAMGVAVKILDDLADDQDIEQEMKSATKAEIAKRILELHKGSANLIASD